MATSRRWRSPLLPDTSTASKDMVGAALGALGVSAVRSNPMPMEGVDSGWDAGAAGVLAAVPVSAGVVAGMVVGRMEEELASAPAGASVESSDSSSTGWAAVGFLPRDGLRVGFFFFFLDGWEMSRPSKLWAGEGFAHASVSPRTERQSGRSRRFMTQGGR